MLPALMMLCAFAQDAEPDDRPEPSLAEQVRQAAHMLAAEPPHPGVCGDTGTACLPAPPPADDATEEPGDTGAPIDESIEEAGPVEEPQG